MRRGADKATALKYAAWHSFIAVTIMELGDGTSPDHGFSYEDQVVNTLGILTSYYLLKHPSLDDKIDVKIEFVFGDTAFEMGGKLFDDYDHSSYLFALKFAGFDSFKDTPLRFFEMHLGYRTRGFLDDDPDRFRDVYWGIALNVGEIYDYLSGDKTNKYIKGFFEYYQPRYTGLYDHNKF